MVMVLFLACSCGSSGTVALSPGDPSRPDVILVSVDSLRPDHLGAYGHSEATSPFLDRLAGAGQRFTEARSHSPWTLPSHVTMLSGRGPLEHEVIEDTRRIPEDLPLIQVELARAGYATGGFVSTIYVSDTYGFARGFDRFEDFDITKRTNLRHGVRAEQVVDEALSWAKTIDDKPIFLFVHLYDVHYPYLPPEPWNFQIDKVGTRKSTRYRNYEYYLGNPVKSSRWTHLNAQYDESIAYADAQLSRLGASWARAGRKVTWVVTADHGEELGEHGSWGHGHTLHPEVMRVPLIVSGDGVSAAAVRDERVGGIDVAATVAALAGVPFPCSGVDVRGPVEPARDVVFETSRFDSARLGLLTGDVRLELDLAGGRAITYEIGDPGERIGVPAISPENLARLWATVGERWNATGPVVTPAWIHAGGALQGHGYAGPGPFSLYPPDAKVDGPATRVTPLPPSAELSETTREQLEALGYQQ